MIGNDFAEKDTLEGRVEKLSRQTDLDFKLEAWPRHRQRGRLYSLSYAFAGQQRGTGPMDRHELLHWTATFALGFRLGDAAARSETPPHVEGPRSRPGTRMLDLQPSSADPMRLAEESIEQLKREHPPRPVKTNKKPKRSGAIGAPRGQQSQVLSEGKD